MRRSQPGRLAPGMRGTYATVAPLILCTVMAAPALATDHFNLESGIPTIIEDIEPIERKSVEFQAFGQFLRMRGGRSTGVAEPRLALGILERTQMEIASPLLIGEGTSNGNGDVGISILRKLRDDSPDGWWPGLAIEADLRLPTGVQEPGFRNRVDAGITALIKKEVAAHNFHVNAGFDWSDDESDTETLRRTVWSVAVGHHTGLAPWLVLVSDVAWRQAEERGTADVWLLESGVRAQLTGQLIGAVGIGVGLNSGTETPPFTVTLGFQIGL